VSEKTVAQKLLIKEGYSVWFVSPPENYASLLGDLPPGVVIIKQPTEPVNLIQVFVVSRQELEEQLPRLKPLVKKRGQSVGDLQ
jgi:hypothetical protein